MSNILLAPVVSKPVFARVIQEWCANGYVSSLNLCDFEGKPLRAGCSPRFVGNDEGERAAAAVVAAGTVLQRHGESDGCHWLYLALPVLNPPTGAAEGVLELDLDALLAAELGPPNAAKPIIKHYHVALHWDAAAAGEPAGVNDGRAGSGARRFRSPAASSA